MLEFRVLGALEIEENGRPIEVSGRRQRALLALLLLQANEVVSSDRLIDGLWGEQPPATAPKVLQNAVSQVRRQLGDELIVTRAPGYLLRVEPDAIDARRFESLLEDGRRELAAGEPAAAARTLREALALWRGPPLDEFAYEPFAEAEIARLEELRLRALEERIEADLALGRHADLVSELERLVAAHPLRERLRGQLMLALYQSSRQAEALQAYQDGRQLLAEELGLEPGTAMQQLERQILTQDPALEPPPLVPLPEQERPTEEPTPAAAPERPRRRRALVLTAIVVAAAGLAAFLLTRDESPTPTVVPDSLVKIDPQTGTIVDVFRVGGVPFSPTVVGDYVFVSSGEDDIISRVDVRSGEVDAFGGFQTTLGLAAGAKGTLWIAEGNRVSQIDANTYLLLQAIQFRGGTAAFMLAVGAGSVWVAHNYPPGVSRFSARTGRLQQRELHRPRGEFLFSTDVAFGEGAAWSLANGTVPGRLLRIDAVGGGSVTHELGELPFAATVGFGAVWIADLVASPQPSLEPEDGQVLRIDPTTSRLEDIVPVGKRPTAVATGGGSVWVANGGETAVWEIDPQTNTVVSKIPTQHYATDLVYGHGFLWVCLASKPFSF
ncbi:MAG TPA: BTAD domain-containing putative transcriptional regulator [Gaiellaceae bacterium]|nr:BTAD domain-containing putative transcriptional regulator [Gaiellaceae bacterium]